MESSYLTHKKFYNNRSGWSYLQSCVWLCVYLCANNVTESLKLCSQDEPQKQEDPAKSPQPKEEGSTNILNCHSPKQENNRPTSVVLDQGHTPNNTEENAEVNMLQNNLV